MSASHKDWAKAYASQGWAVFRVRPYVDPAAADPQTYKDSKKPWGHEHGHLDATTDPAVIEAWWTERPTARVGLNAAASGVFPLDHDSYKALAPDLPDLPMTLTATTPQGGKHYYFRRPEGMWRDKKVEGLDTKGNGYVVMPSTDSGYGWVDFGVPLTALPDAAIDALLRPATPAPPAPEDEQVAAWQAELEALVLEHGLAFRFQDKAGDDHVAALVELERCPFDPADHSAPFKAYVARGTLGGWVAGCQVDGCRDANYALLKELLGIGGAEVVDPEYLLDGIAWKEVRLRPMVDEPLLGWTEAEIDAMDLPPVQWLVEGVLPEGLMILGGKPKVGKSWMVLDLARAIATGSEFLGIPVHGAGDVLYLALEDNLRRLKARLRLVRGAGEVTTRLRLRTSAPRLGAHLEEQLTEWFEAVEEPRLLIVDTLGKVKPKGESDNSWDYDDAYGSLQALKDEADARGVAVVVIHHTKKAETSDPLDSLAGSVGLAGSADAILVLTRDEEGRGKIAGRGRDLPDMSMGLRFDEAAHRWVPADHVAEDLEALIREAMGEGLGWTAIRNKLPTAKRDRAKDIYEGLGGTVRSPGRPPKEDP